MRDLTQLRGLVSYHCVAITDRGVAHLEGLTNLKFLERRYSREDTLIKPELQVECITDGGLAHLKGLHPVLGYLNLQGQQLADAGLERTKNLSDLQQLFLSGEGITRRRLRHLERS